MNYYELSENPGIISLDEIPVLEYDNFTAQTLELLQKNSCHCLNYFTVEHEVFISFYMLIANDDTHKIYVFSHRQKKDVLHLESITASAFQLHVFEREISENTGIVFDNHPWPKPLRYPHNRKDKNSNIPDYPFYRIHSDDTHEVGVGPIHAGIIEPGHFRFQCYGEKVIHLEIQLGYQHRGIERLFTETASVLKMSLLSENIAGDTAVGHGLAFCQSAEKLMGKKPEDKLEMERTIALEMERMAVHVGDTAALCGDIAYQPGQVTCEAIRTVIINTMQDWCGNRYAKGLVRPGGTHYPLTRELINLIKERMADVRTRFCEVTDLVYNNAGVLVRFENTGAVSKKQALLSGAVGMAARTCGISRDIRKTHPFQSFRRLSYNPVILESGDVLARGMLRRLEFLESYRIISELLEGLLKLPEGQRLRPAYDYDFRSSSMAVSLVEGWRGEICHVSVTGANGKLQKYKIKDPSLHNWHLLALSVREQGISDFPVCNKSFNLSYCGNDL